MTNYTRGHQAEKLAAEYLRGHKYKIIELNWKRPRAEIDIVARKKHGPVTFFEVKYRESTAQGQGLDYITPRKLQQMAFAAELWVAENRYSGEYALGAIELSGETYNVTNFLEVIT
jgi:putative endonuclease